jgi:hypothetical protein
MYRGPFIEWRDWTEGREGGALSEGLVAGDGTGTGVFVTGIVIWTFVLEALVVESPMVGGGESRVETQLGVPGGLVGAGSAWARDEEELD